MRRLLDDLPGMVGFAVLGSFCLSILVGGRRDVFGEGTVTLTSPDSTVVVVWDIVQRDRSEYLW